MVGESGLTFEGVLPPGVVALVAAALVGSALWSAHRAKARGAIKGAIVLLRSIAACALAVALLAPSRETRDTIVLRPPAAILVDASESMNLRDTATGATRREAVVAWLREQKDAIGGIAGRYDLAHYDYGRDLAAVPEHGTLATERLTATGDAIAAVSRKLLGRPGASILVVGDGRTTSGSDPLRAATQARERGIRVHTIVVGETAVAMLKDRKVNNVICPSVAQMHAAVPIHGFFTVLGEKGRPMAAKLKINDEVVDAKEIVPDDDKYSARVTFQYVPTHAGERRVTVEIDAGHDEFDSRNNAMTTFLRVVQKDIRILYLEGKLRWEFTFLKRALGQIPGAHFTTKNLFSESDPLDPRLLQGFNVILIGDVAAARLGTPFLQALEQKLATEEAGLMFIVGSENLTEAAGWAGSPMAAMLPFDLAGAKAPVEKPTHVVLTSVGMNHFALTLDKDAAANVKSWRDLPKLESVARGGAPKAASTVLAEAESGEPLLIAQPYGKGRSLAFLGETAWKWVLESDESAEKYRRFWHQCVLWLARKEKNARKLLVDLERYLYVAGDPVEVSITVEDPPGSPVPDASVQVTVEGPKGGAPSIPAAFYGGAYHATLTPDEAGDYRVTIEAKRGNDDFGRATARFTVISPSAELDQPGADPEMMMSIASAGGGLCKTLGDGKAVLDQIVKDATETRIERVHRRSLWDRPWLVLLFVAALAIEWVLRKWNRLL